MIGGSLPPLRNERTTAGRGVGAAPRTGHESIAAQHQAFDYDAAERAEIEREHEILEALVMAFLKNEDEVTKKWIALI
jgi:hypothetical protein